MKKRGVAVLALLACCASSAFSQQMSIFKCGNEYTNAVNGDADRADMLLARGCVRVGMTTDVVEGPAPAVEFSDAASRAAYLRWSAAMSDRLRHSMPDSPTRHEFVQTVWYESKRQGLDPAIVLALIEQSSNFRRFFVGDTNARGYMAVPAQWAKRIGDGDVAKLFHLQTNLRYGTLVLSHYATEANGDMHVALGRYMAESRGIAVNDPRVKGLVAQLFAVHTKNWKFVE